MKKREAPILYVAGLQALAEHGRVSIPEAAITAIGDVIQCKKVEEVPLIVDAAESLHPADIYTGGLWRVAQATPRLRAAAKKIITDLERVSGDEHIAPTEQAFTWFTGETL